jgi:S1-C subfamily serine protease
VGRSTATIGRRVRLSIAALVCLVAVPAGPSGAQAGTSRGGIVVIETTLGYAGGRAAGTGIAVTSTGEVLTNHNLNIGATAIRDVQPGNGRSYAARVVGYDVADDVALLQLQGATQLKTASIANGELRIGQLVTATGNAGGTGRLRTVAGQVTGLSRTITATDGQGDTERLTGLIETSASVVAGDSGGALENATGRVIGMITAAAGDFEFQNVHVSDGYAIPIAKALSIRRIIRAGKGTARIHVGPTAFLGVSLSLGAASSAGVPVVAVTTGGPAAKAGLAAGDVIVRLGGSAVPSSRALRTVMLGKHPGQDVRIVYLDRSGSRRTTTATLAAGPPQ